ncbi:flagellar basal body rod protein FlgB, partial [Buchnera aphidicola]|nr:flagellar basal body rod protein FlgB [Buchnera aphidicola]
MFDKINTFFDFNKTALNLYSKRQEILASNIANADTPGYHSMDIDFLYELKKNMKTSNVQKTQIDLKKTS